jgi:hypothetical protein
MRVAFVPAHLACRGHGCRIETRWYGPAGDQGADQGGLPLGQCFFHAHTFRAREVIGSAPAAAAIASSSSNSSAAGG